MQVTLTDHETPLRQDLVERLLGQLEATANR